MKTTKITTEQVGQRLDVIVVQLIPRLSRAFVQRLCDTGKVLVNGNESKPGYKVKEGESIKVDYDLAELKQIPDIELPILYEDDDCVVINKPVGILTHSKGAFNPEATVATFLRSRINGMNGERAGIVHRLDRATSGVIICAKHPTALAWLQKQFSQRRTKKTYMAIVQGQMTTEHAAIDMPIERNPKRPQTFRVGANGKSAYTEYKVLVQNDTLSLIELRPQTGRTHQLRVHMSHLGHPILGDSLYGGEPADRLYLHALSLELTLPNKERKVFVAPLPTEFKEMVQ